MKINEQLELALKSEDRIENNRVRGASTMFDAVWWFRKLRQAVESAPEWKNENRLSQQQARKPNRINRYKILA
ncbi:MAG: hypothetical protein ACP5T0_02460 [Verrucomicrobiia bacterium]